MSKPWYTDAVRHMLRFYCKNIVTPYFKTKADEDNYLACQKVLRRYCKRECDIVQTVYGNNGSIFDNINIAAKHYHVNKNEIWALLQEIDKKIAQERGLL